MRKLLGLGAFLILGVVGTAAAPSAAEACKHARRAMPPPAAPSAAAHEMRPASTGTPIIVSAPAATAEPVAVSWARDYGRTLLLLAAPAAFVGLALRLHRRGEL